jgi:leucyl aminopeptidase (aminopeptidase T)
MSLEGRVLPKDPDDGFITASGQFGNLPGGEAAIAPIEESVEGILIVDGSAPEVGLAREPIRIQLRRGAITSIEGGPHAEAFSRYMMSFDQAAMVVGELGIGTNDKARLTGNILEDEKALGTFHIGFDNNASMGGKNNSMTHNDVVVHAPTLSLDDKLVIRDGHLVESEEEQKT